MTPKRKLSGKGGKQLFGVCRRSKTMGESGLQMCGEHRDVSQGCAHAEYSLSQRPHLEIASIGKRDI